MFVVALTGGIGSGKSTVADLFAQLGVEIIDADKIARELTLPNQPAFFDILDHFEQELLLENGELDRSKLRKIIFNDPKERHFLETLLHPLIRKEIEERLKKISSPYCLVIIPLLFEKTTYPFINRVLVIDTPEQLQIDRVRIRDQVHPDEVGSIIKTQSTRLKRLDLANDIIVNDGSIEDLLPQVQKLHQQYLHDSA